MRSILTCLFLLACSPGAALGETILIEAAFPGATSTDVVDRVAKPLENSLKELTNAQRVASLCRAGRCLVWVDLKEKVDVHAAHQDVQNILAKALPTLPEEVNRAGVRSRVVKERGFELVTLHSENRDVLTLTQLSVQKVMPALQRLDKVADVTLLGEATLDVRPDPQKLAAFKITWSELSDALRAYREGAGVAAGTIGQPPVPGKAPAVRIAATKSVDREGLLNVVVAKRGETTVLVRDVAIDVRRMDQVTGFASSDNREAGRGNAVVLVAAMQPGADVRVALKSLRPQLPEGVVLDHYVPGEGDVCVHARLPTASSLDRTTETARRAVDSLMALPKVEVRWVAAGNEATLFVSGGRDKQAVLAKLRGIPNAVIWLGGVRSPIDVRPGAGADIEVRLQGAEGRELSASADELTSQINGLKALSARVEPHSGPMPALSFTIDREKAAVAGVAVAEVFASLTLLDARFPREEFMQLTVANAAGKRIPLRDLIKIREGTEPTEIYRLDGKESLCIACTRMSGTRKQAMERIRAHAAKLPKGVSITVD